MAAPANGDITYDINAGNLRAHRNVALPAQVNDVEVQWSLEGTGNWQDTAASGAALWIVKALGQGESYDLRARWYSGAAQNLPSDWSEVVTQEQ